MTVIDNGDPIREAFRELHNMGREEHQRASVSGCDELIFHEAGAWCVQRSGGFIEDQEVGLMDQGREKGNLLLHARRITLDQAVRILAHLQGSQLFVQPAVRRPVRLVELADELDELSAGEMVVQHRLLGHIADPTSSRLDVQCLKTHAVDEHVPRGGSLETHDRVEGRCLARTIRAEKAENFTGVDGHAQLGDGLDRAEALGEAFDSYRRCVHHLTSPDGRIDEGRRTRRRQRVSHQSRP